MSYPFLDKHRNAVDYHWYFKQTNITKKHLTLIDELLDKLYDHIYQEGMVKQYLLGVLNGETKMIKTKNSISQGESVFKKDSQGETCPLCCEDLIGWVCKSACPCKIEVHKSCLYDSVVKCKSFLCPYCRNRLDRSMKRTRRNRKIENFDLTTRPPMFLSKDKFKEELLLVITGQEKNLNKVVNRWEVYLESPARKAEIAKMMGEWLEHLDMDLKYGGNSIVESDSDDDSYDAGGLDSDSD